MGKETSHAHVTSLAEARDKRDAVRIPSSSKSPLKSGPPNFIYHHWDEEGDHTKPNQSVARLKPFRTEYSI